MAQHLEWHARSLGQLLHLPKQLQGIMTCSIRAHRHPGGPLLTVLITIRLIIMRAIQADAPGGPSMLRVATVPPPELAPHDIRIRWKSLQRLSDTARNLLICICRLQW